jgi:hypothetical protein
MPVTLVTGKLGGGKSLVSVGKIRDALQEGRVVATNLDLFLENIFPARAKKLRCLRLPDKPTVTDLELLGQGNESPDETKNGLIVLDELAMWLNARQWGDKERQAVIQWLLHSRKKGWDVIFICQHQSLVDKQVRESMVEFLVVCRRLDRLPIPFFGWLIKLFTGGFLSGRMPRIHIGIVRYGTSPESLIVERWVYRGTDLYSGYSTRQVFSDTYANGLYSYLTPWHLVGRFRKAWRERFRAWLGWDRSDVLRKRPAKKLSPLLRLPPDQRVRVARKLLADGTL